MSFRDPTPTEERAMTEFQELKYEARELREALIALLDDVSQKGLFISTRVLHQARTALDGRDNGCPCGNKNCKGHLGG